jgi:hypothetical protein
MSLYTVNRLFEAVRMTLPFPEFIDWVASAPYLYRKPRVRGCNHVGIQLGFTSPVVEMGVPSCLGHWFGPSDLRRNEIVGQ